MSKRKLVPLIAGSAAAVVGLVAGGLWWADRQHYEKTDNAYVQADTVSVSPQISGYVAEVLVADNQRVQPGQVLVRIDPADAQSRYDQAVANLASQEAAVKSVDDKARLEQAMIAQRAAGVASAEAQAAMAHADQQRYSALSGQGWVSSQKVQQVHAQASQAGAAVAEAQATLEAERRSAQSLGSARDQGMAQAAAARAAVDAARINLDRTVIRAPVAGVVGARAVRPGQYVSPGTALLSVVPLGKAYVVANFKETQVARMRVGQPVEIKADAFGKDPIKGRIDSFAPATGQQFAMIPVENAVGNFTKITQRLPVKIAVDRAGLGAALRPGLSVEVKVDFKSQTGPGFSEAASAAAAAR